MNPVYLFTIMIMILPAIFHLQPGRQRKKQLQWMHSSKVTRSLTLQAQVWL